MQGLNCRHVRFAIVLFVSGSAVGVTMDGELVVRKPNIPSITPTFRFLSTARVPLSVSFMLILSILMLFLRVRAVPSVMGSHRAVVTSGVAKVSIYIVHTRARFRNAC